MYIFEASRLTSLTLPKILEQNLHIYFIPFMFMRGLIYHRYQPALIDLTQTDALTFVSTFVISKPIHLHLTGQLVELSSIVVGDLSQTEFIVRRYGPNHLFFM